MPPLRLTDEQILAIHADPRGVRQTARAYGVAKSTVQRIRQGLVRKYLRLPPRAGAISTTEANNGADG